MEYRQINHKEELLPGEKLSVGIDGFYAVRYEDAFTIIARAIEVQAEAGGVSGKADGTGTEEGGPEDILGR